MPDFDKAQVQMTTREVDLTPYVTFLKAYQPGATVTIPLEEGEKKRMVMRSFNKAAAANGQKLFSMRGDESTIAFRVVRPTGPRKGRSTGKPSGRPRKNIQTPA